MSTQSAMIQVRPGISKLFDAIRVLVSRGLRRLQLEFEGSERKLPSQNQNPNKGSGPYLTQSKVALG